MTTREDPDDRAPGLLAEFPTAAALLEAVRVATATSPIRMVRDFNGERIALPGDPAEGVA